MKFDVFQINLSDEENSVPMIRETYLDKIMKPNASAILKAKVFYKKVATIDATSFNDVFEIGNIGPEEKIQRIDRMHSVSVGDVIVSEDGIAKFVAPIGFQNVEFV
jgi:hypothetical protein